MKFIQAAPNPGGAYPPAQEDWFPGCLPLTDVQVDTVVQHNGFVLIAQRPDPDIEGSTVTVRPNTKEWAAWKHEEADRPHPEPEPTESERLRADVDFLAAMTGVEL